MSYLKLSFLVALFLLFTSSICYSQFGIKIKTPEINKPNETKTEESINPQNVAVDNDYDKFLEDMLVLLNKIQWQSSDVTKPQLMEMAIKLDLQNTIKKINEKGYGSNSTTKNCAEQIISYNNKKEKYYNGEFKDEVNSKIEECYKIKQQGDVAYAIEKAKSLVYDVDFGMVLFPGNSNLEGLKTETENTLKGVAGDYFNKVFTSDFHKNNVGKMLFSNKPIIPGKEDPSQFGTSFSINDRLYAIVYADAFMKDIMVNDYAEFLVTVDKVAQTMNDWEKPRTDMLTTNGNCMNNSYYIMDILPDPAVALRIEDPKGWANILTGLSPRKHKFYIRLDNKGGHYAESVIDIDLTGMDINKVKADAEKSASQAMNNIAAQTLPPERLRGPSKGFKDKTLSIDKMKKLIEKHLKKGETVIKIVVNDENAEEWEYYKNEWGIVTSKTSAEVSALVKDKEGWCWYLEDIYFQAEAVGKTFANPLAIVSTVWNKCKCD
jgi:hypothetical protein